MDFGNLVNDESMNDASHEESLLLDDTEKDEIIETIEETQQPLYKLQNIDTEASIKNELKQLIMAKVSEETNAQSLEDLRYAVEGQAFHLQSKTDQIRLKNKNLEQEIGIDETRIAQSDLILHTTDEMITLLKENVEKLKERYQGSRIVDILERSRKQHKSALQKLHDPERDNTNKEIECETTVADNHNKTLKVEVIQKQDALNSLKLKYDAFKQSVVHYDNEVIVKLKTAKDLLEQNLANITENKLIAENESLKQTNSFGQLQQQKENQIEKLNDVTEEKSKLEQQIEEMASDLNQIQSDTSDKESVIYQKEKKLEEYQSQLNNEQENVHENFVTLKQSYDETSQLNKLLLANISACTTNNDQLASEIKILHATYLKKCEEKLLGINQKLKQLDVIHNMERDVIKKRIQYDSIRIEHRELETQYETSIALLNSLKNEILKEKDMNERNVINAKSNLKNTQIDHDKYIMEMRKKHEYLLANSKFLNEKSNNLHSDVIEVEKFSKYLETENMALNQMIKTKRQYINDCKTNICKLNIDSEQISKSESFKTPEKENVVKKVKFNEILSFKSASSSENSNFTESVKKLETSFHEWLQDAERLSESSLRK